MAGSLADAEGLERDVQNGKIDDDFLGDDLELEAAWGGEFGAVKKNEDVDGEQSYVEKIQAGVNPGPAIGDLHKNGAEDKTEKQGKCELDEIIVRVEENVPWSEGDTDVAKACECEK